MEEILIRPGDATDWSFILATWLRYYQENSSLAREIRKPIFFEYHQKLLKKLMVRETTNIYVAALKEDPFVIVGYFILKIMNSFRSQFFISCM